MASRRRLTLQVTAGMLVFGLLTFLMGLLIGLSSSPPVAAVPSAPLPAEIAAAEAGATPAEPVATAAAAPAAWQEPVPAPASGPEPAIYPAPPVVAAASPPVEKPAAPEVSSQASPARTVPSRTAAPPAKAKASESQTAGAAPAEKVQVAEAPPAAPAPAPAAAEPKRIAGIRVGPPPEERLSSPQRGTLVQAASVPASADVPAPPPAPPARYAVQVARFLLPENAETLATSLRGRGYQPEIVISETPATPAAPSWYLVVIDPKGDWKTAERLAIEVATTLGLPGQVVSWPLDP